MEEGTICSEEKSHTKFTPWID